MRQSELYALIRQTKKNPTQKQLLERKEKKKKDQLKVTESPTLEKFVSHLDMIMGNQLQVAVLE